MIKRGRRVRASSSVRDMIRETFLSTQDFIYPILVVEGENIKTEISSLPGNYYFSIDRLHEVIKEVQEAGISGILLFGIPEHKDEYSSQAYNDNGIVQKAVREIKKIDKNLLVITDVCMCEYTSHGHCGIVHDEYVDNDETLEYLARISVSHAKSGADIIASSDMMDGRISAIRNVLDENGFKNISIMSYSTKYCSAYYGPFRDAANSAPQFGDRKTYQIDPANRIEVLRETQMNIEEGVDFIMVKPALPYLDIIKDCNEKFNMPLVAYNVSGEYAMVKAAGKLGLIDEEVVMMETLTSIKRAGADVIITYHALEAAKILKE